MKSINERWFIYLTTHILYQAVSEIMCRRFCKSLCGSLLNKCLWIEIIYRFFICLQKVADRELNTLRKFLSIARNMLSLRKPLLGTDNGIWRRVRVVPFEYTVSKDKLNKNLLNELKQDKKAVLAWLVKGAIKYYEDGLGTCEAVAKATKKYRKSQDTLGGFIDACIKEENGSEVRARALYEAYIGYCNDNFLNPMSETKFGKDFATRGFKKGKDKVSRKYLDIKLKN